MEAEKRGAKRARELIVIGDGAEWIDTLTAKQFPGTPRIVDWYHAVEHLHECKRALYKSTDRNGVAFVERLIDHLHDGDVETVVETLDRRLKEQGERRDDDGEAHPRSVLARNRTYFSARTEQMRYDTYRARGWPIGSGMVESAVKRFNKRVKGTEMSWTIPGVEAVLSLRAMWLSEDERWGNFWNSRTAYPQYRAA